MNKKNFWDDISEEWIKKKSGNFEKWQKQERMEFLNMLPSNSLILDLGCGSGKDVLFFNSMNHIAIGVDFSVKMLKKSRLTTCLCAELTKLPFKNNVFDGIWSCSVLKYLSPKQVVACLSEARRILKDNGYFWIGLDEGEGKSLYEVLEDFRATTNVYLYTEDTFRPIVEKVGFKIVKIERVKGLGRKLINFVLK